MDFWQNFKVEVEKSVKMNCTIILETEEVYFCGHSGKSLFLINKTVYVLVTCILKRLLNFVWRY